MIFLGQVYCFLLVILFRLPWIICILAKNRTHFPQRCLIRYLSWICLQPNFAHLSSLSWSSLCLALQYSVSLLCQHNSKQIANCCRFVSFANSQTKQNWIIYQRQKKKNDFWANKKHANSALEFINNLLQFRRFSFGSPRIVLVSNRNKPFESIEIYRFPIQKLSIFWPATILDWELWKEFSIHWFYT